MHLSRAWQKILFVLIAASFFTLNPEAYAQTIKTSAGGGPNDIPALSAGLNRLSKIAADSLGNFYITTTSQVLRVDSSGQLTIVAGNGATGSFSGEGGPAVNAVLSVPVATAVDGAGNVYIADSSDSTIRKVDAISGIITTLVHLNQIPGDLALSASGDIFFAAGGTSPITSNAVYKIASGTSAASHFAGNGTPGFSGDTGPAVNAQLSNPQGVFVDHLGNVFIADTGNNRIREVQASTGIIVTVAGNGTAGFAGDGGAATNAELDEPTGVCLDAAGNIFITDFVNSRVRKVAASTGLISTVAGTAVAGFSGDGGAATSAELSNPGDVITDSHGDLLISDSGNNRVRKVIANTQVIQTVAGNGTEALGGDGFVATKASLLQPMGLAIDDNGNVLIADTANNAVRKIVAATGIIETIAGTGVQGYTGDGALAINAQLNQPTDVAIDSQGNIFVADNGNLALREISASSGQINTVGSILSCERPCIAYVATTAPGVATTSVAGGIYVDATGNIFRVNTVSCVVTKQPAVSASTITIAGTGTCGFGGDGGPATAALLSRPTFLTGDSNGNIFIADSDNQVIRELVAGTGFIVTVAGNGSAGFCGDSGPATQACFRSPKGVAIDPAGQLWIADSLNERVRTVTGTIGAPSAALSTASLTFSPAVIAGSSSSPQSVTLSNKGSAALVITGISFVSGNNADYSQTNDCGASVAPLASCLINVTFTPTAGGTRAATLQIADNAAGSPHSVLVTGTGSDFVLSAGTSDSATVSPGQSASYTIALDPNGGFGQSVDLTCSGAPLHSTCTLPDSISLAASATATVTVTTTAPSMASKARPARKYLVFAILGLGMTVTFAKPRLGRQRAAMLCLIVLLSFPFFGCGGGETQTPRDTGATPKGNYTLTVTATYHSGSNSLTHSTTLNLIVQ